MLGVGLDLTNAVRRPLSGGVVPPVISLSTVSVSHGEGASGATAFDYTVTRSGALTSPSSAQWAVTGAGANPATAADFVGGALPSGTVNFAAGASTATISVQVAGDSTVEPDEAFALTLSNPSNATLGAATATGSIVNDDAGTGNGYDVILLMGDSYSNGIIERDAQDIDWPGVYQWRWNAVSSTGVIDTDITPLQQPQQTGTSVLSPAEYLGKAYTARTGRKVLIVPRSQPGSKLSGSDGTWAVGQSGHENAIPVVNAAIAAAKAAYADSQFVGIFQWLTANDGASDRATIRTLLAATIPDFRSRIAGAASSWFAMGGVMPENLAPSPTKLQIEFALRDVHRVTSNVQYVPGPEGYPQDSLHYSNAGNRLMGGLIDAALGDTTPATINTASIFTVYEAQPLRVELSASEYVSWFLTGTDAALFEVTEETFYYGGSLLKNAHYKDILRWAGNTTRSFSAPADAGGNNVYDVVLNAKDSHGNITQKPLAVTVKQAYGTSSTGAVTATHMSSAALVDPVDQAYGPPLAFGAGLNLIYIFNVNQGDITALSVNGVPAVKLAAAPSSTYISQLWAVPLAQAGTYTVAMTGAATASGGIEVMCLTNTVMTPAAIDRLDWGGRSSPFSGASLTCPANGLIVGMGLYNSGLTGAASGTTLLSGPNTGWGLFDAYRASTGSIGVTASQGSSGTLITASFAKAP